MITTETIHAATRADFYAALGAQARALLHGEADAIANAANLSALLYHALDNVNWVGFYLMKQGELVLGPFQGKPACIRIPVGRGVCGTAAASRETLVVADVDQFPGHIACDAASRSEMVVPVMVGDRCVGVLDIDSPMPNRFTHEDRDGIEPIVAAYVAASGAELARVSA